ncbi:alpha/beta hydrolase fold domain-containing protein [Lysinibacter sp. HNR]|uniref:alpha/beta hydrolase fold domain-containing protein n=1 Tax=Lysinibacter sp. HNR TaxID=3031408 RepID=UPI0024352346|nr:alpha/beta hydrolase fold domain-containing protein [Lysinibacter sp. HNR]WGD38122.1 alpha/beta hydrolase fold domain-containing protein [Lysinibacter sp. HNR]
MSFSMFLSRIGLRLTPARLKPLSSVESLARYLGNPREAAAVPEKLAKLCFVEHREVRGFPVVTLTPRKNANGTHVIYTHGGAYVMPIADYHWGLITDLVLQTRATITVPLYGLAPDHSVREAYEMLDEVYATVCRVALGGLVILAGDSAGGGLAIGQAIRYRDSGVPTPNGVIVFSPWLDIEMKNPSIDELTRFDHLLSAPALSAAGTLWAGGLSTRDPLLSPLFDSLESLPPVFVYQGGRDILLADTFDFTRKMAAIGGDVELRIYPTGFHNFFAASTTPESKKAVRHAARTIVRLSRRQDTVSMPVVQAEQAV